MFVDCKEENIVESFSRGISCGWSMTKWKEIECEVLGDPTFIELEKPFAIIFIEI